MQISTSVGVVQYIRFSLHSIQGGNINYVTPDRKTARLLTYASWCEPEKCIAFSMGSLDIGLPPGPDFFNYGRPNYAEACSAERDLQTCRSTKSRWSGACLPPTRSLTSSAMTRDFQRCCISRTPPGRDAAC